MHPQALKLTGIKVPRSGLEGEWSVYHSVAATLVRGTAGEHEYGDACVLDPTVAALRTRVVAVEDASLRQDEAHIRIELVQGPDVECHVEHALGSVDNPMSDAVLDVKFGDLVEPILGKDQTEQLLRLCWDLRELDDVSAIALASVPQ